MGLPRFDTLVPTAKKDYVAVFDQNLKQVFSNAKILKNQVKEDSKIFEHPVETGITISDDRILLPIEIELSLIVNSENLKDTYKTIRQLFLSATLLIVQTRGGVYKNQLIATLPSEEDPEYYASLTIALKLKQVQFYAAKYAVIPKSAKHTSTVDRGTQQATQAPPNQTYLRQLDQTKFKAIDSAVTKYIGGIFS